MKTLRRLFTFLAFWLAVTGLRAHEGMWIPMLLNQLNISDMQANGLKLSAEDIYSINKSSLKDAVVHFGGGCTAEMISPDGLLLTNHHCGYGQIQSHSSLEHDYLTDGFWAKTRKDELKNPGLTATFIVRMEDVTKQILSGVEDGMAEADRQAVIAGNIDKVGKEAVDGTHYDYIIRPFYYGNEYYMFITETFKDVRLVGAPPSSIGKFGFDTDNWVWPRHTGDFSIFRIYAGKDGKPADPSDNNVPFHPRHYFPISLDGVETDDFTMVYGFPGRTEEYVPSYAVDYLLNKGNPAKIEMRKTSLGIIDAEMRASDQTRIQYAAKQSRISNAYKKWIGQSKGLVRLNAVAKKQELEQEFIAKVSSDPRYKGKYGKLFDDYKAQYSKIEKYALARDYFIEAFYVGPEILRFASRFEKVTNQAVSGNLDGAALQAEVDKLSGGNKNYFKNYNARIDKRIFSALMELYHKNLDRELHPDIFATVETKFKGDWNAYADFLYSKSQLTSLDKVNALMDGFNKGKAKKLQKDPAYIAMQSVVAAYRDKVRDNYWGTQDEIDRLHRTYMKGLMDVLPTMKKYYPDANSTLRIAYGKVEGYYPQDGVKYRHYTTLAGIVEKEDPDEINREFNVPKKLIDLYNAKDYGQYGQNGEMRVCFTASNHTTGGNSGSPVLDAHGNLIGLNFDRSWESTMSDIMFDPEICRNIMVDVRYVLFIVDKFAGASHLVDEMKLVHPKQQKAKAMESSAPAPEETKGE